MSEPHRPLDAPPPRPRNAGATRQALLDAARVEFSRRGFDEASTRRIATAAGCNVALINRYFGSKAGLFEEVMDACIDLSPLAGLQEADLIDALVTLALRKPVSADGFDPMAAAIRSSGSDVARDIVRRELGDPMVATLAAYIGGETAEEKAGVILSIIAGAHVGQHAIGATALSDTRSDALRPLLHAAIANVLKAPSPR